MYTYSNPSTSTNPRGTRAAKTQIKGPLTVGDIYLVPQFPPTDSCMSASFSAFPLTYSHLPRLCLKLLKNVSTMLLYVIIK